jgi:class 3 adenylate cyclase
MDALLILTVLLYVGSLAVFIAAVRSRWFSRRRRGFLMTVLVGLGVAGVGSTLMVGVWGHHAARGLLRDQVDVELDTVGHIMEQQIDRENREAFAEMAYLSRDIGPGFDGSKAALMQRLQQAQEINPRLLQLRLTDLNADIKAERSVTGVIDPMNRVAAAYSLDEGKPFASDPFLAAAFGKYVLNMSVPVRSAGGKIIGSLGARYDIEDEFQDLTRFARFNASGYAVVVSQDGHILAHPETQRMHDDVSAYPAVQAALAGKTGSVIGWNKGGSERLFVYRPLKGPATMDGKPLALLTELDQAQVDAIFNDLRTRFLLVVLVVAIVSMLVASFLSSYIEAPLLELAEVAQKVAAGDLSATASGEGEDEVGLLARALNSMVRELSKRQKVIQVFGTYVASEVSEKVLNGQVQLEGDSRKVTVLFSDIRGFTSMSEKMSPREIVAFLNNYFTEMVEAVFQEGGMLDKFIGDGLMAYFGALESDGDHARRAVNAGLRMKALVGKINGERGMHGKPPIAIGIGIHTDDVVLGNVGSMKRLQYTAIGDGVNTASRIEALNKNHGTTLLISEATYVLVKDHFECRLMPETAIRGKSTPIQLYEVLSAKASSRA